MNDIHNPNDYATTHGEEEGKRIRKTIWRVFWVLLAITTAEVLLGIYYQHWNISFQIVKVTFIVMTLLKAFFIITEYMHLKHENPYLKKLVAVPYLFLAVYFIILLLTDGGFAEKMMFWLY